MSDQLELAAETRDRVGKGASRALRRDGRVPAVIYGQNQAPQAVHLEEKALVRALMTGHFMNSVIMVGGARTLAKDVAFHPVTDRPVHVDFLRVGEHTQVTVAVPVAFTGQNQSPGIEAGGVLNVVAHELELVVDAAEIPTQVTVSVAGLNVGESLHLSQVALPAGAKPAAEGVDLVVATMGLASADRPEGADAETPATELMAQDIDGTPSTGDAAPSSGEAAGG